MRFQGLRTQGVLILQIEAKWCLTGFGDCFSVNEVYFIVLILCTVFVYLVFR